MLSFTEDAAWLAITLFIVIGAIALSILLAFYSGLFHEIKISTGKPPVGEIVFMYKMARGEYGQSGHLFTAAHSLMPEYRCIGVYYDDPTKRPSSALRYLVGSILSSDGAPVNEEHEKVFRDHGYSKATFPSVQNAVFTSFPFLGSHTTLVGVFRVYPALREYTSERSLCAHPMIEIYDGPAQLMHFIGPLELQDSFHVPELEDERLLDDPLSSDPDVQTSDDETRADEQSWENSASLVQAAEASTDESTVSSFEEVHLSDAAQDPNSAASTDSGEDNLDASPQHLPSSPDQAQAATGEEVDAPAKEVECQAKEVEDQVKEVECSTLEQKTE